MTDQELQVIVAAVKAATKESTQEAIAEIETRVKGLEGRVNAHDDILGNVRGGAKTLGWVLATLVGIGGTVALIREAFWPWPSH